ncbi:MAG: Uma2 family endonuclease [Pirellulaceae bacterium]|nr:Uma2 family endonuclease [Pirellulaceae bacterium]
MNAPYHIPLQAQPTLLPAAMPDEPCCGLSVGAYHAMLEAGILASGDPVELLEGWLVPKMTKGPKHEYVRRALRRLLERLITASYFVDEQGALTTADSEPEPDLLVVRGSLESFADRHPGAEDVALVVEIADSSLQRDRTRKKRIYARAGLRVYWVVNVAAEEVEVYSRPNGESRSPAYQDRATFGIGAEVPVVIDGTEVGRIAVAALFGHAK